MPERLQDWVSAGAERRPESVAVVSAGETLTYAQLEARSNQLARLLRDGGCKRGDRVALLMPKSPGAIVSILGIYKADGIYVPLDPSSPPARLAKILASCENRWILATARTARLLHDVLADDQVRARMSVGWMDAGPSRATDGRVDFTADDLQGYSAAPLDCENARDDAAHILFTSGSTGVPKGVVITHASVIAFVEWAVKYFGLGADDRVSGHPPLHFDLSIFDIFGTFAAGAQLHLVPSELNVVPTRLTEFIRASALTQWFSVPSVLKYMAAFDVVRFDDFPALRRLLWCGEVFPTASLVYWMKRLPHVTFTNLYGPTEATIASSYYTVPRCPEDERAAIPIGAACDREELLVLDESLRPVPRGEAGDLYIRGVGLSPGYWRDPEKTRAVFLRNPRSAEPSDRIYKTGDLARIGDDGLVYFLGRADSQIKSRGYRIELGEIEAALNAVDGLQECAVVAIDTPRFDGALIGCAYVPAPGAAPTPVTLHRALSRTLPSYMLPSRWLAFERLPKNANGKIDRRTLKEALERDEAQADRQP